MANSPESFPETPETKEHRDSRWRRAGRRALIISGALSLAASAGATIEANQNLHPEQPIPNPDAQIGHTYTVETGVSAGRYDIIPGEDGSFKLPGLERSMGLQTTDTEAVTDIVVDPPTRTAEQTKVYMEKVQNMIWAEQFGIHNPGEIQPRGPDAVQAAVDRVKQSLTEGKQIVSIEIQGTASDESDKRNAENNPGLGVTDKKNENLADMRGRAVTRWFEKVLEQSVGKDTAKSIEQVTTLKDGLEIQDEHLNKQIVEMARSLGLETDDMVMSFNRGENLPGAAEELLQGLKNDRYVTIRIEVADQAESEDQSARLVTEITKTSSSHKVILVFVPILIPPVTRGPRTQVGITNPTDIKPPKTHWGPAPKELKMTGHSQQVPHRINQPDTGNAHYGKGSGGRVATSRGTSHRGQRH
ncbi:MAG: hypothetical protein NTV39_04200 [Candidatus Saccharibacteria bacterium]|nr:hypothetical protein [Candidatus Saccharibacteria bacterium]